MNNKIEIRSIIARSILCSNILNFKSIIVNLFTKIYLNNKLRIQKHFKPIIAFIFIIHICFSTLVYTIYDIKVLCYLVNFLPFIGLI